MIYKHVFILLNALNEMYICYHQGRNEPDDITFILRVVQV